MGEQRRRRLARQIEALRRQGLELEDVDVQGDVVDVRLAGSTHPRVTGRTVELECPACGGRLQVIVAGDGASDWRHSAPPCRTWLGALQPGGPGDAFRDEVAALVRRQLVH